MNSAIRIVGISIFFLAVALGVLLLTGEKIDFVAFAQLTKIDWWKIPILLASLVAWWILLGIRIRLLATTMPNGDQITVGRGIMASLLALFSAAVTPSATGMSFGLGWYLSRYLEAKSATAIAVYSLVLDLVFYAWSLPASFLVLRFALGIDVGTLIGIPALDYLVYVLSGILLTAAWMLSFRVDLLAKLVWNIFSLGFLKARRARAYAFVQRTGNVIAALRDLPWQRQLLIHFVNFLNFLFHFGAFNVLGWALGIPNFDHGAILAFQSLVVSVSMLVPTPGGTGYFEVALPKLFGLLDIPAEARVPLALMWRFLSYFLYIIIGPFIGGAALLRAAEKKA